MIPYPQSTSELKDFVWRLMQRHKGYLHRIGRDTLTIRATGKASKSYDRKVRDALSELPVVWDDGYFIPVSRGEASLYITQMKSRQAAIGCKIKIIEDYLRHDQPIKAEQMHLISVG